MEYQRFILCATLFNTPANRMDGPQLWVPPIPPLPTPAENAPSSPYATTPAPASDATHSAPPTPTSAVIRVPAAAAPPLCQLLLSLLTQSPDVIFPRESGSDAWKESAFAAPGERLLIVSSVQAPAVERPCCHGAATANTPEDYIRHACPYPPPPIEAYRQPLPPEPAAPASTAAFEPPAAPAAIESPPSPSCPSLATPSPC